MNNLLNLQFEGLPANAGLVLVGIVLLFFGAEWLVKGSVNMARMFGVSPLIIGLTIVAFGTSAPELFVGISLNKEGLTGTAVGNVVGSNICNIFLMLGIAAAIRPLSVHRQILKFDMPVLIVGSFVFTFVVWNHVVSRGEGALLFAGIIAYLIACGILVKKGAEPAVLEEFEEEVGEKPKPSLVRALIDLGLIVIGLLLLVAGAESLKTGSVAIAERFGVPQPIIGLTLIAIGTSLPEIATAVVATVRKHGDIVVGNAIGSCIFNITAVLGLVVLIKPMASVDGVSNIDVMVMLASLLIVAPFMFTRKKLDRIEGVALLLLYGGYCYYLYLRTTGAA